MSGTDFQRPSGSATRTHFWSATRLIAQREITVQIRAKSFWISFAIFVVGLFALAILPGVFGGDSAPRVATVGADAARVVAATELEALPVGSLEEANALVRDGEVEAAVVDDRSSPTGVRVVGMSEVPLEVTAALVETPPVQLLAPDAVDAGVVSLASFVFALVFFMFAMSGIAIAQSVVTEKQTRIVEILAATVPVRALLTGKILAYSVLTFGQVGVLALLTPIALRAGEQGMLLSLIAPGLGWFVPYFILGFILLAAMWAVDGSLVSRMEDLGSSSSLVTMLVLLPYFGVLFFQDNELVLKIMSFVPFTAAVAMPVRMFKGDPAAWEPLASLGVLATAVVVCIAVGSRLYTGSLLQTGARVKLGRAWAGAETV